MSQTEGVKQTGVGTMVRHNATFFQALSAPISTGAYTEVSFTDHDGVAFESHNIRVKVIGAAAVDISFDPTPLEDPDVRVVQGQVATTEVLLMEKKFATSIFVRSVGAASAIQVMAWR